MQRNESDLWLEFTVNITDPRTGLKYPMRKQRVCDCVRKEPRRYQVSYARAALYMPKRALYAVQRLG
jgi:hypothetical protein